MKHPKFLYILNIAKVNLKKHIKAFKERQKKKDLPKIEGIETLLFRYNYGKPFEQKLKADAHKHSKPPKTGDTVDRLDGAVGVNKKIA